MFTPYGRTKDLLRKIQGLEDRLTGNSVLSMIEQSKIHLELQKYKKELQQLEAQTRK